MAPETVIRAEALSKRYTIGAREARYKTLRESVMDVVGAPFKRLRHRSRTEEEILWALKDVSFEIRRGEVVGIIGRNGAGKSTLLKILSRITEPTSGRAQIHGRVGSLLEVGTGFHPELTGRENIYLNGAILGMRRAEIDRKLDEIVAFAEVERFIDTAVKHYSSGMYLRLAFAVAAHMDTEVLLVDEVLAVGDAAFQAKCLGKMGEAATAGRTVLFVSHNLGAISALCPRALFLKGGELAADGSTPGVTARYLHGHLDSSSERLLDAPRLATSRITSIALRQGHTTTRSVSAGQPFSVDVEIRLERSFRDLQVALGVSNVIGTRVYTTAPRWSHTPLGAVESGTWLVRCTVSSPLLLPGSHYLKVSLGDSSSDLEVLDELPPFEVVPGELWPQGSTPQAPAQGLTLALSSYEIQELSTNAEW